MDIRRRKGEASSSTTEEPLVQVDVVADLDGVGRSNNDNSLRSKKKKKKESSPEKAEKRYDHLGREVGPDGWFVDPAQLPIQKRIEKILTLVSNHEKKVEAMPDARGVVVSISLTKLDHIDTVTRSCYIDFGIQMWWKEDKVRGKDDGEYEVSEFDFKPDVVVHNSVDLDPKMKNNNDNHTVWTTEVPNMGSCKSNGILSQFNRYKGTVAFPMELRHFPFDKQTLELRLGSDTWPEPYVSFLDLTDAESLAEVQQQFNDMHLEFEMISVPVVEIRSEFDKNDMVCYSFYIIKFEFRRRIGFYMMKIVLVLYFLGLLMAAAFVVPADVINDRFQITATLFLSAVAFNFVVAEQLPKYSNSQLGTYAFLVLSMLEHIVMFYVQEGYGKDTARRADWACIGIFIGSFTLWTAYWILSHLPRWRSKSCCGCCICCDD